MGVVDHDEVTGVAFRVHWPTSAYVRIDWFDGTEVTVADAQEAVDAIASLTGNRPAPVLVDMRGIRSIARDARKLWGETSVSSRTAMYVESALSRTVANFFVGVGRPEVPSRVFTDVDEARKWLLYHE